MASSRATIPRATIPRNQKTAQTPRAASAQARSRRPLARPRESRSHIPADASDPIHPKEHPVQSHLQPARCEAVHLFKGRAGRGAKSSGRLFPGHVPLL